jgi:hypothetical protein
MAIEILLTGGDTPDAGKGCGVTTKGLEGAGFAQNQPIL